MTEEKIWEGWQVEKIKGGRFAKFANQCKGAALNLLGQWSSCQEQKAFQEYPGPEIDIAI